MKKVESEKELRELLEHSRDAHLYILKHSTRCPVSGWAFQQVNHFSELHPKLSVAYIDVIGNRDVSNLLAEQADVPHASPQIIHFKNGERNWSATHHEITMEALNEQLEDS